MSDSPVRPGPPGPPASHGRTAGSAPAVAIDLAATPRASYTTMPLDVNRLGTIALLIALVTGALLLDHGRHEPVAGFGIIPQPGAAGIPASPSALAGGDPAPNFRLRNTEGDIVELTGLRGQPVLIHFWTTWCLECAVEIPTLRRHAEAHAGNLHVVGIDVGESAGRVEQAANALDATYPMLLDREMEVARYYGVQDYPATVTIDANGTIVSIEFGPVSAGDLDARVNALLGN